MAETKAFDQAAADLERLTDLDRLEARGTLRLALKAALFEPDTVSTRQMRAVIEKVLGNALRDRGVDDADAVCSSMLASMDASAPADEARDSADDIFGRMVRRG